MDSELLLPFIQMALEKYPLFTSIVFFMGACRVILKPLMSLARTIVAQTPSKYDDEKLDAFEKSKFFITMNFLLDWVASVKIKPVERKVEAEVPTLEL